jgi:hypothetical protein
MRIGNQYDKLDAMLRCRRMTPPCFGLAQRIILEAQGHPTNSPQLQGNEMEEDKQQERIDHDQREIDHQRREIERLKQGEY